MAVKRVIIALVLSLVPVVLAGKDSPLIFLPEKIKEEMNNEISEHSPPTFSQYIYEINKSLHTTLLNKLIETEFNESTSERFLNFVSKHNDEVLHNSLLKMYRTIKEKKLSDYVLMDLAYKVKETETRGHVADLLNLFSPSLRALLSKSLICIKSREFLEFMFGGEDIDQVRRSVNTWTPRGDVGKSQYWDFQRKRGNTFNIVNYNYNEDLYAEVDSFNQNPERRRIFTRGRTDANTGGLWAVEFDGDDVFIRNVSYDEYIYPYDPREPVGTRRDVFAWIPKGRAKCDVPGFNCRWRLFSC